MRPIVLIPGLEEGPPTGLPFSAGSSLPGPTPTGHHWGGGSLQFLLQPMSGLQGWATPAVLASPAVTGDRASVLPHCNG